MKCRHCKADGLPDHAIYCPWCGKAQARQKTEKKEIKNAIAFVEEHTGAKWDWDLYFAAAKRVNDATRCRIAQLEINATPYPQFFGAAFRLYNDTNYMSNSGRDPQFVKIDHKLLALAEKGYREKRMYAREYRHRAIVWSVQPQYVIDMLYWLLQCWGIMPLADMLSIINTDMIIVYNRKIKLVYRSMKICWNLRNTKPN